jgi:hypothetical protein
MKISPQNFTISEQQGMNKAQKYTGAIIIEYNVLKRHDELMFDK